jgi:hypothetical protein
MKTKHEGGLLAALNAYFNDNEQVLERHHHEHILKMSAALNAYLSATATPDKQVDDNKKISLDVRQNYIFGKWDYSNDKPQMKKKVETIEALSAKVVVNG